MAALRFRGAHALRCHFAWTMFGCGLVVAPFGCGGSERPPELPTQPSPLEERKEAAAPRDSSAEPDAAWTLVAERRGAASVQFVEPTFSLHLDGPKRWVQRQPGREGGVMLDDHRPRPLSKEATTIELSKLIPEDLELAPGQHQIVVCEESDGARVCSGRAFFWTVEGRASEVHFLAPDCLLWEPGGTYFAADAIPFLALGASREDGAPAISYRIHHGDKRATVEAALNERLAVSLPVGDTRVELLCGPSSTLAGTRTITINPGSQP